MKTQKICSACTTQPSMRRQHRITARRLGSNGHCLSGRSESQPYLRRRDSEEQLTLVAIRDGAIVGFATLVPADKEVRAVYVSHTCGRQGVGSQLLGAVEQL